MVPTNVYQEIIARELGLDSAIVSQRPGMQAQLPVEPFQSRLLPFLTGTSTFSNTSSRNGMHSFRVTEEDIAEATGIRFDTKSQVSETTEML